MHTYSWNVFEIFVEIFIIHLKCSSFIQCYFSVDSDFLMNDLGRKFKCFSWIIFQNSTINNKFWPLFFCAWYFLLHKIDGVVGKWIFYFESVFLLFLVESKSIQNNCVWNEECYIFMVSFVVVSYYPVVYDRW